jgi:hypothetical protein
VTIDQLSFSRLDPALGASKIPMIDNPQPGVVNVGIGLCPSLMGTFNYPPPQDDVNFISNHHKVVGQLRGGGESVVTVLKQLCFF